MTELLCEYPATKIQWKPNHITGKKDLFAVSSDMLRVYSTSDDGKKIGSPIVLHNVRILFAQQVSFRIEGKSLSIPSLPLIGTPKRRTSLLPVVLTQLARYGT